MLLLLKRQYWKWRESTAYLLSASNAAICGSYTILRDLYTNLQARKAARLQETVNLDRIKVKLKSNLSQSMAVTLFLGNYELPERTILDFVLTPDDIVLEMGTGVGVISVKCALKIGSERIHTFEANPALIPWIKETYELNGVSPNLSNAILGKGYGEKIFYVMPDFWSSSVVKRSDKAVEVTVPEKDFNDTVENIKPTFLIVDIEGGEYELFQYAQLLTINKIMIELHERVIGRSKTDAVVRLIESQGFVRVPKFCVGDEQLLFARQ